ncbi:MAG: ABC transporter permease [Chloroflexi bacterium]|nr:ABC transporter permease [Chloroflexota bacterium]
MGSVRTGALPALRASQKPKQGETYLGIAIRQLRRNASAQVALAILLLLILASVFAPVIAPYDPLEVTPTKVLRPPSAVNWMGTDYSGRDILSRILFGGRTTLLMGAVAVSISASVGVILGLISGYYGGRADMVLMRLVDMMLAFPGLLSALVVIAVLGPGILNAMIAVGVSGIPQYARLVRSSTLVIREMQYIEAARAIACRDGRIIVLHILPNVVAPVIVVSTLGMATAILAGGSLSFLGVGVQPPQPEWGSILAEGRRFMDRAWWVTTLPGVALMITILCINILGDGLRDAFDPRLRLA